MFDPAFPDLTLDQFIEKISAMGLEAVEIGAGGYPNDKHCPAQELLDDPAKLKAWRKKFDDKNIKISVLSCHGNPVHPDKAIAERDIATFKRTVLLAEKFGVKVIVGFSGCPGGTPTDSQPNWITYRWPPEYAKMQDWQWKEKVIPYWKEAAKFAREHGVHRLALEMHPNFVVYNPLTLLKLREAVGPEIGANCDLSHLFWQGCDPVAVIRLLGKEKCLFHAHMKDTCFYKDNVDRFGVLNFVFEKEICRMLPRLSARLVMDIPPTPGKKFSRPIWKSTSMEFSPSRTKILSCLAKLESSVQRMYLRMCGTKFSKQPSVVVVSEPVTRRKFFSRKGPHAASNSICKAV